jgi:hypothetical protein
MTEGLRYPEWQQPLLEAILGGLLSPNLEARLGRMETVIRERLQFLNGSRDLDEQQALADALQTIQVLLQQ